MPHADSSLVPDEVQTKQEFYEHISLQLEALLDGSRYWVSNLAQVSSLLYHAFLSSSLYGSDATGTPIINWVGFYLYPPSSILSQISASSTTSQANGSTAPRPVPLGPFHGKPACTSFVPLPGKGVCADTFTSRKSLIVEDVNQYPGHIACDGDSQSEIVIPLVVQDQVIGVFDLDSTALSTFNDEDRNGLEKIVNLLVRGSDWT